MAEQALTVQELIERRDLMDNIANGQFIEGIGENFYDGLNALSQAATLGFGDEIGAATTSLLSGGDYQTLLDQRRADINLSAERSPVATMIGGAIGVAPAVTAGIVTGNPLLTTAGLSSVSGFATGESDKDRLQQAGFGALLSLGGTGAGKLLSAAGKTPLVNRISKRITKAFKKKNDKVRAESRADAEVKPGVNVNLPTEKQVLAQEQAHQARLKVMEKNKSIEKAADAIVKSPLKTAAGLATASAAGVPGAGLLAGGAIAAPVLRALDSTVKGGLPALGGLAGAGVSTFMNTQNNDELSLEELIATRDKMDAENVLSLEELIAARDALPK